MDSRRLKDPAFLAAAASCVLLLVLLFRRTDSTSKVVSLGPVATPQSSAEFDEAVSMAEKRLENSNFDAAYDLIMVASRIAPSDPRLFDLVMSFVDKAKLNKDDDVTLMVEDLLDRGDSLVHFQSPSRVEAARKRLDAERESLTQPNEQTTLSSPLETVRRLLTTAENSSVALSVRSRAAEHARSALDDVLLDQAMTPVERTAAIDPEELKQLQVKIDAVEKQCVTELFLQSKSKIDPWLTATTALAKESDNASADKVPDLSKTITAQLTQGYEHLQELTPYAKSGVEGAAEYSHQVEKQVKLLQRQKTWLYNQQALRLIREIEGKSDWSTEDKIRHLAEVSEELLSPYVLRRHNELWEKVFESLPDEDKKVWAVRLRVLRLNEE